MLVKFYGDLSLNYKDTNLEVISYKQLMAGLKHTYGQNLINILLYDRHYYILSRTVNDVEEAIPLYAETVDIDISTFDCIHVLPELSGEISAAIVAGVLGTSAGVGGGAAVTTAAITTAAMGGSWAAIGTLVATAVVNTALSMAISYAASAIMQAISPTPKLSTDPSSNKLTSSLFNGVSNTVGQGGSVPLIYGRPFCGGPRIYSGLSTEQVRT